MVQKIIPLLLLVLGVALFQRLSSQNNICANTISCIKDLSGKFESGETKATFLGKTLSVPGLRNLARIPTQPVLGASTSNKRIEVDLTHQTLHAFEDGKELFTFPVSSGKWYPTPTGTFHIWIKLRYTKMEGGDPAIGTYYNLPNVPYVMFFYNNQVSQARGFSLHGTYWHNNFGHPMSHGCVNMRTEDVEKIFYWVDPSGSANKSQINATADNPGTEIVIYGEAPKE